MAWRQKLLDENILKIGSGEYLIAGTDEAGRGCLAGPVVAAAVILPEKYCLPDLKDSKLLSSRIREKLAEKICDVSIAWGIGLAGPKTIDKINILQASLLAMAKAFLHLSVKADLLVIDGNFAIPDNYFFRSPFFSGVIPEQKVIIGGDRSIPVISAASILAKTWRDRLMLKLDARWPMYGFAKHKGYGTKRHFQALEQYGPLPVHRKTFQGVVKTKRKIWESGFLFDHNE